MRSVQVHTKDFISFHLTFQNKTKQLALFCWSVALCNHKKPPTSYYKYDTF